MTARKLVPESEINAWMTNALEQVADCQGSKLKLQYRLQQPDETGCNWSSSFLLSAGPNTDATHAGELAARIVEQARAQFNVID